MNQNDYLSDFFIKDSENFDLDSKNRFKLKKDILNKKRDRNYEEINKKNEKEIDENNKGRLLLMKMGYKKGDSLGKNNKGLKEPLNVCIRKKEGIGFDNKKTNEEIVLNTNISNLINTIYDEFNKIMSNLRMFINIYEIEIIIDGTENEIVIQETHSLFDIFEHLINLIKNNSEFDEKERDSLKIYVDLVFNLNLKKSIKVILSLKNTNTIENILIKLKTLFQNLLNLIQTKTLKEKKFCIECSTQFDDIEYVNNHNCEL